MNSLFYFLLLVTSLLNADIINYKIYPYDVGREKFMNIKILDTKELKFALKDGIKFTELSDLAYKSSKLFAISDRGLLFELSINLENDKINNLTLENAFRLKDKKNNILKKKYRDSEGMAFCGKNLLISFEKKHRVDLYTLGGKKIKSIEIHKKLQNRKKYRTKNKGLEAVIYSKKYGVITAPEIALKNKNPHFHTLYSPKEKWRFKADGFIKALEFVDEDRILVLLHKHNKSKTHRVVSLIMVNLQSCKKSLCDSKVLAKLDSVDGWKLDNFEGLTKVAKNKFLMISDDNEEVSQKTLLVLFEIMD